MKNKVLRIFLAIAMVFPMFTSVFAMSYDDLLDRLEVIMNAIEDVRDEYKEEMEKYPDVISSLSDEGKATVEALEKGAILEEGMKDKVKALKAELAELEVEDADKVLNAVEGVQDSFEALIDENKDVVEDVKSNYSNYTTEEIKEVVKKVTEIVEELGAETDVTETYDKIMTVLDEAHTMSKDINTKLEKVLESNVETFESALTKELLKEILTEVKNKDKKAVIDTLIEALEGAQGGAKLKADLKDIKKDVAAVKNKLLELKDLEEQDLLMFEDSQKEDVAAKFKLVEKDYIDFAKVVLDNYAYDYMDVVINLGYKESVDDMINYANQALDYYDEYKDTIKGLEKQDVIDRVPEELASKAGLMVALGFVDTTDYNKDYVTNNFKSQIEDMKDYIANEFVDYLDHIDTTISDEVMDTYSKGTNSEETQKELRAITAARFNTIENLKALKSRVDTELLANKEEAKDDLDLVADYVYEMYYENILMSTGATLEKENEDAHGKYETTYDGIVITNVFMPTSDFSKELGIPEKYKDVLKYTQIKNDKIRTGSALTIALSDEVIGTCEFAVLGDVYIDGMVDARDYMAIKNYIMEKETLSKVRNYAADTYRDKLVDARDYMAIKNYIMKGEEISL